MNYWLSSDEFDWAVNRYISLYYFITFTADYSFNTDSSIINSLSACRCLLIDRHTVSCFYFLLRVDYYWGHLFSIVYLVYYCMLVCYYQICELAFGCLSFNHLITARIGFQLITKRLKKYFSFHIVGWRLRFDWEQMSAVSQQLRRVQREKRVSYRRQQRRRRCYRQRKPPPHRPIEIHKGIQHCHW